MDAYLKVEALRVEYGGRTAIDGVSFEAKRGELLTLLGPSGCGKTTTLRAIAGFIHPAGGRILLDGRDISFLPPHKRNIGMVFQSYALFPHLSVRDNVGFGLRMRQVRRPERDRRAMEALDMVGLAALADRYPTQLSGGQQQRVALARALVIEPDILLLDEPLSNLDANLRAELRDQIRSLQTRLGIMTIMVTHDQQEAIAVSDRIAVLNDGRIVDIGPPEALCNRPSDAFAAAFIGGRTVIRGKTVSGVFEAPGLTCAGAPEGATAIVLRGPRLRIAANDAGPLSAQGKVVARTYLGDWFETDVETPSGRIRMVTPSVAPPPAVGEDCRISAGADGFSFIA